MNYRVKVKNKTYIVDAESTISAVKKVADMPKGVFNRYFAVSNGASDVYKSKDEMMRDLPTYGDDEVRCYSLKNEKDISNLTSEDLMFIWKAGKIIKKGPMMRDSSINTPMRDEQISYRNVNIINTIGKINEPTNRGIVVRASFARNISSSYDRWFDTIEEAKQYVDELYTKNVIKDSSINDASRTKIENVLASRGFMPIKSIGSLEKWKFRENNETEFRKQVKEIEYAFPNLLVTDYISGGEFLITVDYNSAINDATIRDMAKLSSEETNTLKALTEGGGDGESIYKRLKWNTPANIHLNINEKDYLSYVLNEGNTTEEEKKLLRKIVKYDSAIKSNVVRDASAIGDDKTIESDRGYVIKQETSRFGHSYIRVYYNGREVNEYDVEDYDDEEDAINDARMWVHAEKTMRGMKDSVNDGRDMYFIKTSKGYYAEDLTSNGIVNTLFVKTPDRARPFYDIKSAQKIKVELGMPAQIEYSNDFGNTLNVVDSKLRDGKDVTVILEGRKYRGSYNGQSSKYPDMADVYIPELVDLYNRRNTPKDDLGNTPKDGKYYVNQKNIINDAGVHQEQLAQQEYEKLKEQREAVEEEIDANDNNPRYNIKRAQDTLDIIDKKIANLKKQFGYALKDSVKDAHYTLGGYEGKNDPMAKQDISEARKYGISANIEEVDGGYQLVLRGSKEKLTKLLQEYFGADASEITDSTLRDGSDKDELMDLLYAKKYTITMQHAKSKQTGDPIDVYTAKSNQLGKGFQFAYNSATHKIEAIIYADTTGIQKKLNGVGEVKALLRDASLKDAYNVYEIEYYDNHNRRSKWTTYADDESDAVEKFEIKFRRMGIEKDDIISIHQTNKITESEKCVICGKDIQGYGNNAEPVKSGKCCDLCNQKVVIPARLKQIKH